MGERLSQDAVERIVRRAIELEGDVPDPDHGVSVDALLHAAGEIGIPRAAVLEAVAIERLGEAPERRLLDRLVGPSVVVIERRIELTADDALSRLDRWLVAGHHLRRERRDPTSATWRKRGDLAAGLQRGAKSLIGGAGLGDVRRLDAVAGEIGPDATLLRVLADRRVDRGVGVIAGGAIGGGSVATAGVVGTAVVGTAAAAAAAAVAVPGLLIAGSVVAFTKRGSTELERELTRLLDQVAAGEDTPRLVTGVARRLGLRP